MRILGLNKTTLLDYPGKVAATLFTGGCNFRCPYCHNSDIVLQNKSLQAYSEDEIFAFLKKRKNVLTGVCITGGEPTINNDLPDFISRIKDLGYFVKLDTNGTNPSMLEKLISDSLIDYCAMDIKNSPKKYGVTVGVYDNSFDMKSIKTSAHMLMSQTSIDYEFRTTLVSELHTENDMFEIANWISDAKAYFLQSYTDCEQVMCKGFHAPDTKTLVKYLDICRPLVPRVELRGVEV